jgi:hypothetical protein
MRKNKKLRYPAGAKKAAMRHIAHCVAVGLVSESLARKHRGAVRKARAA